MSWEHVPLRWFSTQRVPVYGCDDFSVVLELLALAFLVLLCRETRPLQQEQRVFSELLTTIVLCRSEPTVPFVYLTQEERDLVMDFK